MDSLLYTDAKIDPKLAEISVRMDSAEGYAHPHGSRVAKIAEELGYAFNLAVHDRLIMQQSALVHDIGEIAMNREYFKENRILTTEEHLDMQRHPVIGEQQAAKEGLPRGVQLLIRWHHEWWNGGGYPDRLEGEQIPLAARILRVADTFGALTGERPFRKPIPIDESRRYMIEWAGIEFDPRVVKALISVDKFFTTETRGGDLTMFATQKSSAKSWLAFELNVLRRLKFKSAAIPFSYDSALGAYLKRWNVRVSTNDPLQSAWIKGVAGILNNVERLSAEDVNVVLEDAYVPRYKLHNPVLRDWFNETDSWWFDNVRQNIDLLPTPVTRAIASIIAMATGDYVLSFTDDTLELRQPLSNVFRRLWTVEAEPVNNGQNNSCQNKDIKSFIASENGSDLMFLRLPQPHSAPLRTSMGKAAWREEWIRGGNDFWPGLDQSFAGKLGSATETKSQYLHLLEETFRTADHIDHWAISHVEDGFLSSEEVAETIGRIRAVNTVFTKDFSELTGMKAAIITA